MNSVTVVVFHTLLVCVKLVAAINTTTATDDEFIDHINNKVRPTWVAGKQTRFLNRDAFKNVLMKIKHVDIMKFKLRQAKHNYPENTDLPENFDARYKWSMCRSIPMIRDQAECASCYAFAAAMTMSDRFCIHSNGAQQPILSAEDMLSCCKSCGNCQTGGYMEYVMQYLLTTGLVTGGPFGTENTCMPYKFSPCSHATQSKYRACEGTQATPSCVKRCLDSYGQAYSEDKHKASTAYQVTVENIQQEIFHNGPVSTIFLVHTDFYYYRSGVYEPTVEETNGMHAVRVIGWGVENEVKYWLVANTWNKYWGDNGTFKIKRGENTCGFESRMLAALPLLHRE